MQGTRRADPDTAVTVVDVHVNVTTTRACGQATKRRKCRRSGLSLTRRQGVRKWSTCRPTSRSSEVAARRLHYEVRAYKCMQAESLKVMASEAQHAAQHAESAKCAAEADMVDLKSELQATQARMAMLKEQMMTGQAAAEECEAQVVQDAVQRIEAELTEKLRESQREVCEVCLGNWNVLKSVGSFRICTRAPSQMMLLLHPCWRAS